jgi:hypothetical protein
VEKYDRRVVGATLSAKASQKVRVVLRRSWRVWRVCWACGGTYREYGSLCKVVMDVGRSGRKKREEGKSELRELG